MGEKIKITFLGSGSSIPTEKRNHPSVLIEYKDEAFLFDCGEGTQKQLRIKKISPCKITRIFISHWHADHVIGLPGLLQTLSLNKYNKELKIYGPEGTKEFFSLYEKLFINKFDPIKIKIFELKNSLLDEKDFFIESREMKHNCPCIAYSFKIKDKKRINKKKLEKLKIRDISLIKEILEKDSFKLNDKKINSKEITYIEKGKKVVYITDTSLNKNILYLSKEADLLIIESTYSSKNKDLADSYFHLTVEQSCNLAKKAKVKKVILFHLSQRYEKNIKEILSEAKKIFKEAIIAQDFDIFFV
ncbi:MAG: ribonuclease Z [Candidatus Pacearchaeota archaeon]